MSGERIGEMDKKLGPPFDYVLEEEIDAEILLYDTKWGSFLSLNDTAADVWRLADGDSTLDEVIAMLARAYQADTATLRADVEQIVAEFREAKLLP